MTLGIHVEPIGSHSQAAQIQAMTDFETLIGRQTDVIRSYISLDEDWLGALATWGVTGGRLLHQRLNPWPGAGGSPTGTYWTHAQIASGVIDSTIVANFNSMATRLPAGAKVILHYCGEPKRWQATLGGPDDFKAAVAHVRGLVPRTAGVQWCILLTAAQFVTGEAALWIPKGLAYSVIGADGYAGVLHHQGGKSADEIFGAAQAWADAHNKATLFGEVGKDNDVNTANTPDQATWMRQAASWFNSNGAVACYSDVTTPADGDFTLTTNGITAFAETWL